MSINHDSPLFTVNEAADYLNMSKSSLYRVIQSHNVPTVRLLRRKQYIAQETLDALITNPHTPFKEDKHNDN
jgi:excisionase family DNA binding protein